MKKFSKSWNKSKKPTKQRNYRRNAPLHVKGKFLHANLSKELRAKYGVRSLRVIKGDKVRIMRGSDKKKEGVVDKVSLKKSKIFVQGIFNLRKDGNKTLKQIDPSNIQIIELKLDDKKRLKNKQKTDSNQNKQNTSNKKPKQEKQ